MYPKEEYIWKWNANNNLIGYEKKSEEHRFSWQPHGSQFTILEDVPKKRLAIQIQKPPTLKQEDVLGALKFDPSWIKILK